MTVNDFNSMVASGDRCVVKIGASWCGPCKILDKEIELLESEHPEVKGKIYIVDIEEHPDLAEELKIMSVPVCAFIGDGSFTLRKGLLARQGIFEWVK